jgi:enediyne biosynthesis protein E2
MPTTFGSLLRRLLTPRLDEVTFERRGFPVTPTEATRRLELIPQSVICGFEWGIDSRGLWEVERRLSMVEPELEGFAYEGATMAFTVRDAMAGGRGKRARELLLGPGQPHIFLTYIGIGFAMARLPRVLWKKVMPELTGSPFYPTMTWLAVDGYGFDRAYFDTRRWVDEQYVPKPYPWAGDPDYFLRAVDQGIGRALWFIHGGRAAAVADAVRRFADHRQADLWGGVGLAATFAGGSGSHGLAELRRAAGRHRAELAVGVVFAVKARTYAGFVPPHTALAATTLADVSIDDAVAVADGTAVEPDSPGPVPPYEQWRQRIRDRFLSSPVTLAG